MSLKYEIGGLKMKKRWIGGLSGTGITVVLGILVYFFVEGALGTFLAVIFLIGGPLVFLLVPAALASMARKEKKIEKAVQKVVKRPYPRKKCPKCDKEVPEDANLCPYCGHDFTTEAKKVEESE